MPDKNKVGTAIYFRWFVLRAILMIYDILAVNAAFFLALLTRFYIAKEFHSVAGHYIDAFTAYAPIYTLFCLAVFAFFRLYSGMWKYAGLHDLNRILGANVICFAGHVVGTLLFGIRMPITFYCIGAVIQLVLIGISRFSYRLLLVEKKTLSGGDGRINTVIIGVGSTARAAMRAMERESVLRPVCMVDYRKENFDAYFDGIPVVIGLENLKSSIEKYHAQNVLIASATMPSKLQMQAKEICAECGIEVQNYAGFFQSFGSGISLKRLAEFVSGPVELTADGKTMRFDDCEQAMSAVTSKYVVKAVTAKNNVLCIELGDNGVVQNDLNQDWVKKQQSETGEEISFF